MKMLRLTSVLGLAWLAIHCANGTPIEGGSAAKPIQPADDYGDGYDPVSGEGGQAGAEGDPSTGGAAGFEPGSGGAAGGEPGDPGSGGEPASEPGPGGAAGAAGEPGTAGAAGAPASACGGLNQACCSSGAKCFAPGTSCNAAGKCVECGGNGQACCDSTDTCEGTKAKCCHDCGGAASGFHCICGDSYAKSGAGSCKVCCVVCNNGFKANISAQVGSGESCDGAADAVAKCADKGGIDKTSTGWKNTCS